VSGALPAVPPRAPAPRRWTMPRLQPPDPLVAPHHMEKHMASKLLRVGLVGAVLIAPLLSAGTAVLHAQAVPCDPALVSVAISPSAASIALGGTQQFRATGTYLGGTTRDLTPVVSWVSSPASVLSIAPDGLATGIVAGDAQVTAVATTTGQLCSTANVSVASVPPPPPPPPPGPGPVPPELDCPRTIAGGVPLPPGLDPNRGLCLFSSTTAFRQSNPTAATASCQGCHKPSIIREGSPIPILAPPGSPFPTVIRRTIHLGTVLFNAPLGRAGQHGGTVGDDASVLEAIRRAAAGAINSPIEMSGLIDRSNAEDEARLASLVASIIKENPAPQRLADFQVNFQSTGTYYARTTTPDAAGCLQMCRDDPTCAAYTWRVTLVCDLKSTAPDGGQPRLGFTSGIVRLIIARRSLAADKDISRILQGADFFFGRTASTQHLVALRRTCASCHPPPTWTDNRIRTNVLHPDAAFFRTDIRQPDGGLGPADPGAGLVTVTDPITGRSIRVGTFKTPSLRTHYPNAPPSMHDGSFPVKNNAQEIIPFYGRSLGFVPTAQDIDGFVAWNAHCATGENESMEETPVECL